MKFETVTLKIKDTAGKIVEVQADPNKFHETWLAKVVEYGTRRFPNDSYSAIKGDNKVDMVKALVKEMESGEAMPERVRKSAAPSDPIGALVDKNAKADLMAVFKHRTGKGRIADIVADSDTAINAYFNETESGHSWNQEAVAKFVAKQKEAGKKDYRADAEAMLAMDI